MIKVGIFFFLLGLGLLWFGAKQGSNELRKIGLGMLVAGVTLGAFSLLDVQLLPN